MKRTLLLGLLLPALAAHAYQPGKTYRLTVLHTNDTHGRFWANEHGEYGQAAQQTLVKNIRTEVAQQGGALLMLHAGDINTGVPESDLQNARPDIEGMNAIGYEAMTLGNHEFDNPLQLLAMQEKWAKFPFLSANTHWKSNGKNLVKPYVILNKQGLNIAVVGLTTEDTAVLGNPEYTGKVRFDLPETAARQTLAKLAEKPVDITIGLTHMGYYENGRHGSNAPGDVELARALPAGAFDMIIGGHSHTTVCTDNQGRLKADFKPGDACTPDRQNSTWIMQAGEWGKYLGRADFTFKDGKLALDAYRLIPVNLKYKTTGADGKEHYQTYQSEITPDAALFARLKTYQDQGDKLLNVNIGQVEGKLEGSRDLVRRQPTNLGRLIARAQREFTQADLAIINSGGIRDSIESGKVSYRDILKVQPFGNTVSYISLTGSELADYLKAVGLKQPGSGGYPQLDNVQFDVDYGKQHISHIRIGGQELQADKTYRLSLPSYLAAGGDGYPKIADRPSYVNTGFVDAKILKQYFQKHSPLQASAYAPQ